MERLNKFISRCGAASRRKAEELIAGGAVSINGKVVEPGPILINPDTDEVKINGIRISPDEKFVYYMLHKPEGYATTVSDPHQDMTVMDLIPSNPRVFPVGRLDLNSSGLLLLTNDGELANLLTHPSFEHEKEYEVFASWNMKFPGRIKAKKLLSSMEGGIMLDGKQTSPSVIEPRRVDESGILFRIILREGRKRQIRRMCESVGLEVRTLKRIRIGRLLLGDLIPGDYAEISRSDIL